MVLLHMKTTSKELPISDIIATGYIPFFKDISENCAEFRGQKNLDRFRLVYNGRVLKPEDLVKITDNDAIRVILLPESKVKKSIDEGHKKAVDAELRTLSNPFRNNEDRRLHGFNHDFNLPEHVSNALKSHPQLVFDSHFLCIIKDWFLFRAYCIRGTFKNDTSRGTFKYTNPDFLKIYKDLVSTIGNKYGFNMGEQRGFVDQRQAGGAAPITQAFLQNALQAALAGVAVPPAARPPAAAPAARPQAAAPAAAPAPVRAAPQQPAEEPMQQGYEQQAAILREYGFENDELIQLALEQANGDLQAAMELLIELQN